MFLGPVVLVFLNESSSWMVSVMTSSLQLDFSSGIVISSWSISLEIFFIHLFGTFIIPILISGLHLMLVFPADLRIELELLSINIVTSWRVLDILWVVHHGVSLSILK